jgi:dihydroflavonol-4-reductase
MTLQVFLGRLSRISEVKAPPLTLPRTSAMLAGMSAELVQRAAKALGLTSPLDRISAEMAQYFWYCNAAKAERVLDWEPRDPGDTLHDTIEDLLARGVVWPRNSFEGSS